MILIVVAHPDDEVLWFAGGIRSLLQWGNSICVMSLTNSSNPVRKAEFEKACSKMGVFPIMADLPDGAVSEWEDPLKAMDQAISIAKISVEKISIVITHSPFGNERQHPQHFRASEATEEWANCNSKEVAFFSEFLINNVSSKFDPRNEESASLGEQHDFSFLTFLRNYPRIITMQKGNTVVRLKSIAHILSIFKKFKRLKIYNQVVRFRIDLKWRSEIVDCYQSQSDGLRSYSAFSSNYDYLYIKGASLAKLRYNKI